MALASVGTSGLLCLLAGAPYPVLLALSGIVLLWMYSYPPIKISYGGGGEFLQMIGVGIVLPLMGYFAFKGSLGNFPWELFFTILPTQLACAIGTAVPDAPSDAADHHHTHEHDNTVSPLLAIKKPLPIGSGILYGERSPNRQTNQGR